MANWSFTVNGGTYVAGASKPGRWFVFDYPSLTGKAVAGPFKTRREAIATMKGATR